MTNVKITTNLGEITLELNDKGTEKTTKNFVEYVESGFYNGTIFHRVIDGFMIQGGGMDHNMEQKPNNAPISNEAKTGIENKAGTISMARTSDPNSATSQFFINLKDNDFLNFTSETMNGYGYCAFGKVTSGMDIVEKIGKVSTTMRAGHQDVPVENIIIEKAEVVSQ